MNILFLTKTDGHPWAGPSYSMPRQIRAQAEVDNVFWYNLYGKTEPEWDTLKEWRKKTYYHDLAEYPAGTVADLPAPFCKPNVIVVEQFYEFAGERIVKELMTSGIPYVIVPRSQFTEKAQKRRWYKKLPVNIWRFYRFARSARAIQYLTNAEAEESGTKWNRSYYVIANGCDFPEENKLTREKLVGEGIRAVYIGRIEMYQKGLDLLVEAVTRTQERLRAANFRLNIYGPNKDSSVIELSKLIKRGGVGDLIKIAPKTVVGEEKKRILLDADVFVMPSRFEGHPMALIEALAYGLPCLATNGTNMRKEIERANAGWGCEVDACSIADALQTMISEDSLDKMAVNAIGLASRYNWDSIARRTSNTLKTLSGKSDI